MHRKRLWIFLPAVLALLLTACASSKTQDLTAGDVNNGILSDFTTTDLEGNSIDQTIFADYPLTMVNVWATFCTPCLNEMPDLGELAAEYESRGVQFVGLVSDTVGADGALDPEQVELAKEAVAETGASYRHLLPSEDLNGLLSQIYAVPTTFFVDSRGRQVGSTYMRAMSREEWEAVLDGILAELPDGEAGLEEN